MFEEIFQDVGRFTDLIFIFGLKYWYISIILLIILFYLFIRFWGIYMGD